MTRWASPTTILLYRYCPRRYFRQHILRERGPPSLHLILGQIVHRVLARLTRTLRSSPSTKKDEKTFKREIQKALNQEWARASSSLEGLKLTSKKLSRAYWSASILLRRWLLHSSDGKSFFPPDEAEVSLSSKSLKLRGILDAVVHGADGIELWDYKTSRQTYLSEGIELQLALYALLYQESTGQAPAVVVANFLRGPAYRIPVNPHFLDWARCVVRLFHFKTLSQNSKDYPCRCGRCPETAKATQAPETASRKVH